MVSNRNGETAFTTEYINVVRLALEALSKNFEGTYILDGVRFQKLIISAPNKIEGIFPIDGDSPIDDKFSSYIFKIMEYVQSFLVVERLSKEMKLGRMLPKGFDPNVYIEYILYEIGRGLEGKRNNEMLRYYPMPHLQVNFDIPFIDFAGFLSILLFDFISWKGDNVSEISQAAIAEIDTALDFLINPSTFIEDDDGIGWGFIPGQKCDTRNIKLASHRHPLPTAWAIVALCRNLSRKDLNVDIKTKINDILEKSLKWLISLRRPEGLFGTQIKSPTEELVNHNYITEALLTLMDNDIVGSKEIGLEALERFLVTLSNTDEAFRIFDPNIQYSIRIKSTPALAYADHTTWATLLSTIAYGVSFLRKSEAENADDNLLLARNICAKMARHIVLERRNSANLWQRSYLQFHWVLTAVESLMRFTRFAQPDRFDTSVDAVMQAVNLALRNEQVIDVIQNQLVKTLKTMSAIYSLDENVK